MANETVTVDGTKMPMYEAIQKQRAYERAVRKTKRELVALDEAAKNAKTPEEKANFAAAFESASVKLKAKENRLALFCKETGLDRDRTREQMFAAKTENGIRNFGKSTASKAVWANKRALTASLETASNIREKGISGKKHFSTAENRVNFDYVNSKTYKAKFMSISENQTVNNAIYLQAKAILTHRSGTYFEDLCLIDGDSGKVMGITANSKAENVVTYSMRMKEIALNNPNKLISVHNHGTNNPPTGSDLVSAGYRKYRIGVVVCHNGDVYTYKSGMEAFSADFFDKTVDKLKKSGYNEAEAIRESLNRFAKSRGIEWRQL